MKKHLRLLIPVFIISLLVAAPALTDEHGRLLNPATVIGPGGTDDDGDMAVFDGSGNIKVPNVDIDANTQKIINVVDPSSAQHAATKNYVDTTVVAGPASSTDNAIMVFSGTGGKTAKMPSTSLDAKTQKIINVVDPSSAQDAATKAFVETASTSGNAATATALAANGANCSAGNYPLGVNASGAVESCTAIAAGIGGTVSASTIAGASALDTLENSPLSYDADEIIMDATRLSLRPVANATANASIASPVGTRGREKTAGTGGGGNVYHGPGVGLGTGGSIFGQLNGAQGFTYTQAAYDTAIGGAQPSATNDDWFWFASDGGFPKLILPSMAHAVITFNDSTSLGLGWAATGRIGFRDGASERLMVDANNAVISFGYHANTNNTGFTFGGHASLWRSFDNGAFGEGGLIIGVPWGDAYVAPERMLSVREETTGTDVCIGLTNTTDDGILVTDGSSICHRSSGKDLDISPLESGGRIKFAGAPTEATFSRTCTITSAAAGTPVNCLSAADVPAGKKAYISSWRAEVDGATPWATTATCAIEDTTTLADFITFAVADMTANAFMETGNAGAATVYSDLYKLNSGGGQDEGIQIDCDANGTGSDFKVTIFGMIK